MLSQALISGYYSVLRSVLSAFSCLHIRTCKNICNIRMWSRFSEKKKSGKCTFLKVPIINLKISNFQSNKQPYEPWQMCCCGFFSAGTFTDLFAHFLPTVFYIYTIFIFIFISCSLNTPYKESLLPIQTCQWAGCIFYQTTTQNKHV